MSTDCHPNPEGGPPSRAHSDARSAGAYAHLHCSPGGRCGGQGWGLPWQWGHSMPRGMSPQLTVTKWKRTAPGTAGPLEKASALGKTLLISGHFLGPESSGSLLGRGTCWRSPALRCHHRAQGQASGFRPSVLPGTRLSSKGIPGEAPLLVLAPDESASPMPAPWPSSLPREGLKLFQASRLLGAQEKTQVGPAHLLPVHLRRLLTVLWGKHSISLSLSWLICKMKQECLLHKVIRRGMWNDTCERT